MLPAARDMDSGGGYLVEEDSQTTDDIHNRTRRHLEEQEIDRLDNMTMQIQRKFRKRTRPTGYQSLSELWQDFVPLVEASLELSPPQAIQRMLNLTSYFYDFCHAYRADTEQYELKEYFEFLENAWIQLFQEQHGMTDRIRALNVLRDGHDQAADVFGIPDALNRALQAALPKDLETR